MAEPDAQSANASGGHVWVGRAAMLAFTAVLATEIVSGKGVFEVRLRTTTSTYCLGCYSDAFIKQDKPQYVLVAGFTRSLALPRISTTERLCQRVTAFQPLLSSLVLDICSWRA